MQSLSLRGKPPSQLGAKARGQVGENIAQGDAARDQKRWQDAERSYARALAIDESMAHIWVQLGHALKEQAKLAEAESAYRRGVALAPNSSDGYLQLGHLLKVMGKSGDAEDNYRIACELNPTHPDAANELAALGWPRVSVDRMRKRQPNAKAGVRQVVIEVSDLVDFLQRAAFPTGIQRVQLAISEGITQIADTSEATFATYDYLRNSWYPIERHQIRRIIDLVDEAAILSPEARLTKASRLREQIFSADEFDFQPGSVLVNPGTSWGFLNYFLALRDARNRVGLRYVPFVHDCIPLIYPEYCSDALIGDFISWLSGMLIRADLILVNSENTRIDVAKAAAGAQACAA